MSWGINADVPGRDWRWWLRLDGVVRGSVTLSSSEELNAAPDVDAAAAADVDAADSSSKRALLLSCRARRSSRRRTTPASCVSSPLNDAPLSVFIEWRKATSSGFLTVISALAGQSRKVVLSFSSMAVSLAIVEGALRRATGVLRQTGVRRGCAGSPAARQRRECWPSCRRQAAARTRSWPPAIWYCFRTAHRPEI